MNKEKNELIKRIEYEKAISSVSRILLEDPEETVQRVLDRLRNTTKCSRVYIFRNSQSPEGDLLMTQTDEVCSPGVSPQKDNPVLKDIPYSRGFTRWERLLMDGECIQGAVRTFPREEQGILASQNIKTILVIPVITQTKWWGFIGFDDTFEERQWKQEDIELLRAAAEMLGRYFHKRELTMRLTRSVREKEILLREIHHRVKNNLAMVESFISIQEMSCNDPGTAERFKALSRQVHSITEVHNLLYKSRDLSRINLADYIQGIIHNIFDMAPNITGGIQKNFAVDSIPLDMDTLLPLGLIVTEFIWNSLKHAFSGRDGGKITLKITGTSESFSLVYADDGPGIPQEQRESGGLGSTLITELVKQIGGTMITEESSRSGYFIQVTKPNRANRRSRQDL